MESWKQEMIENNYLTHHGILGQKWGVRRFQNVDGTLTEKGKSRYDKPNKEKSSDTAKKHGMTRKGKIKLGIGIGLSVAVTALSMIGKERLLDAAEKYINGRNWVEKNCDIVLGTKNWRDITLPEIMG